MGKDNIKTIHRPLSAFYYGSLAVIFLSLTIGAYYFSYKFVQNEKNRAEISTLQLKDSINAEYRYMVEEFFTSSYDSIAIRVSNALEKFGNPSYDLYLFNTNGTCVYAKNREGSSDCSKAPTAKENVLSYEADLKLATNVIGKMRVVVEDRFQFFTGNLTEFAFNIFAPIFLIVGILWISWVVYSRNKILIPYYKKMLMMEKDKASFDTIRQIIHDTKGEIASLDLLSYEIEDTEKAREMRSTLDKIRKAFDNLHQVKESIIPIKIESLHNVHDMLAGIESHLKVKYKHLNNFKLILDISKIKSERIKLDSALFERVIFNLVENSVTAPCKKENLIVKLTAEPSNDGIIIQLIDNGEGISEENLKKVFEKGFTTKSNGTGQGLSFVKAQVESWKGEISINSTLRAGTTVTLSLPLAEKPKFIILDDDKYLLDRYQKMLQRFGNEARTFRTGKELLDNAKSINPESIFLLDYDLGNNEVGTDVAQKLSKMGMKNLYLHTGNPMTDEMDYPFLKGILTKGNFAETMKALSLQ